MTFQLDAENMTIFLLNEQLPFQRTTLIMMRIKFIKRNNGQMELQILTRDLEGTVFTNTYQELPFLGPMNINIQYSEQQMLNLNGLL